MDERQCVRDLDGAKETKRWKKSRKKWSCETKRSKSNIYFMS